LVALAIAHYFERLIKTGAYWLRRVVDKLDNVNTMRKEKSLGKLNSIPLSAV
jgi:hypothetical protein